jgi:hypothetical protein
METKENQDHDLPMGKEKTEDSVTLSDGRVVTRHHPRVRQLANAEAAAKGKEHLVKYAIMSAKLRIDGKVAVLEDILDMYEDDLILVGGLFQEEEEKN